MLIAMTYINEIKKKYNRLTFFYEQTNEIISFFLVEQNLKLKLT